MYLDFLDLFYKIFKIHEKLRQRILPFLAVKEDEGFGIRIMNLRPT